MKLIMYLRGVRIQDFLDKRSQHLVFLAHVWACSPFLVLWLQDPVIHQKLGDSAISALRPYVWIIFAYLLLRTILAIKDPARLKWEYVFPPIDVLLISSILFVSHRGPLSNLTLLYFLPIIQAASSLNVRWSAFVGALVVGGTIVATLNVPEPPQPGVFTDAAYLSSKELFKEDPINASFRIYFLILMSSLMAYQARLAAEYREKAGVAADRNRIALEMHDGVQGSLITLASQMELIKQIAESDGTRVSTVATQGKEVARAASDELRFLVQRLRSPLLTENFVDSLRQYTHNICSRHDLLLEFLVTGIPVPLGPEVEHAFFRISQEALNNVVKHSHADRVKVEVSFLPHEFRLSIQDNGKGVTESTLGSGLTNMKQRAEQVSAICEVTRSEPSGTLVLTRLRSGKGNPK